ncbi:MAG: YgjV family protein, partial [Clostridia bacterium]|nr:YgjV family protein [Clostridia bacterium]
MNTKEIIGQIFGIFGLLLFVLSFQCKNSKKLVFVQGIGGMMFFINFLLIGAYGGALFNLTILIRGLLYAKKDNKIWKPLAVEVLFTVAYVYSLTLIKGDVLQIKLGIAFLDDVVARAGKDSIGKADMRVIRLDLNRRRITALVCF